MERDAKLQQIFIRAIADITDDKNFIVSALTLLDTDEQRVKLIDYMRTNKELTKKDLQKKMAYISVGKG